jgi:Zn ribbon nucleic-acid-binding protein
MLRSLSEVQAKEARDDGHSPCPFCGSLDLDLVREGVVRYVRCVFCGSRGPARPNTAREAWRLWDRWTHSDESFRAFNNRIWK